jgi:hypothetical protein
VADLRFVDAAQQAAGEPVGNALDTEYDARYAVVASRLSP